MVRDTSDVPVTYTWLGQEHVVTGDGLDLRSWKCRQRIAELESEGDPTAHRAELDRERQLLAVLSDARHDLTRLQCIEFDRAHADFVKRHRGRKMKKNEIIFHALVVFAVAGAITAWTCGLASVLLP